MSDHDQWDVYAVKYATMAERRRTDNFIAPPDPHDGIMPIDYFLWAVTNGSRTFVVDTGFDAVEAERRGRTLLRAPNEGLAMIGIDAGKVEDVIVTHLHYDHVGGHDMFPAATYYLQETEMQYATGPHMCSHAINHPFTADHVAAMVHRVFEGRVNFVSGECELAPGLTVHLVGGHSMGLQIVRVKTRRGWVVLASDASHFYENMDAAAPFPIVFNVGDMVRGWERVRELADSPAHIVPGHDPLVLERYPAVSSDLDGIAIRLDAAPSA